MPTIFSSERYSKGRPHLSANYEWPGNIRERENVLRRAVALGKEDLILPEDLPPNIYQPPIEHFQSIACPSDESMATHEKAAIQDALDKSKGNRKKAAQILSISEATVYRKMRTYQIKV